MRSCLFKGGVLGWELSMPSSLVFIFWLWFIVPSTTGCETSTPPEDNLPENREQGAGHSHTGDTGETDTEPSLEVFQRGTSPRFKLRFKTHPGEQQVYRTTVSLTNKRGKGSSRASFRALALLENKGVTRGGFLFELTFPRLENYSPRVGQSEISTVLKQWKSAFVINEFGLSKGEVALHHYEKTGDKVVGKNRDSHSSKDTDGFSSLPLGSVWPKVSVGEGAKWSLVTHKLFSSLSGTHSENNLQKKASTKARFIRLVVDTAYKIDKIDKSRSIVHIMKNTNLRLEDGSKASIGVGTGTGNIQFDMANGRILKVNSELDLEINAGDPKRAINHTQSISMTRVTGRSVVDLQSNKR